MRYAVLAPGTLSKGDLSASFRNGAVFLKKLQLNSKHQNSFQIPSSSIRSVARPAKRIRTTRYSFVVASSSAKDGTNESNNLFIFGFGYSALGVATQLSKKGW